jgi:hypothetical protein
MLTKRCSSEATIFREMAVEESHPAKKQNGFVDLSGS